MNALINILAKSGLLTKDLDYHLIRASMVLIFLAFGYQKWWPYEAQVLIPSISNGPLIFWMYSVFGIRGASFQEELGFPPAPKLDVFGKLDPSKATAAELRGQEIFFGKGQCGTCHTAPYYTDNLMHDLKTERFFKPVTINNMYATSDGAIKTFTLRGVKNQPPYLHDGRLLTLDDTVEFFNLVLGTKLTGEEKRDLVAFLRTL